MDTISRRLAPSLCTAFVFALALAATGCCRGSSDSDASTKGTTTPKAAKTQAQIDACKAECSTKHKTPRDRLQCYIPCN